MISNREKFAPLLAVCLFICPLLAGCQKEIRSGGPDIKLLEAKKKNAVTADAQHPLLPLSIGSFWEMTAYCHDPALTNPIITHDRYTVTGTVKVNGIDAIEVQIQREGKKWRRELYLVDKEGVSLAGAQDEDSDLMTYAPPIPLFKYPATEGDYQSWGGTFHLKKVTLPARALSRITAQENLKTPAGIFRTLRVDTTLIANQRNREIRFLTVRWLAPDIGFARRGYMDKSRPAIAEVTRFNVR